MFEATVCDTQTFPNCQTTKELEVKITKPIYAIYEKMPKWGLQNSK